MAIELEFEMVYCDTNEKEVKKYSYPEVFGHPQPNFDKKFDWKTLPPGFRPVQSIDASAEMHVVSEGKIGMGMDDPRENLSITNNLVKPSEVFKYYKISKEAILDKIGIGLNPFPKFDIGECPKHALSITPEVDTKDFTEKVKALQYDLERAKDRPAEDKLIDAFAQCEFGRLWNSNAKNKKKAFFDKTWDLTKKRSNNPTDYSDYAEFLDEYFDEDE